MNGGAVGVDVVDADTTIPAMTDTVGEWLRSANTRHEFLARADAIVRATKAECDRRQITRTTG